MKRVATQRLGVGLIGSRVCGGSGFSVFVLWLLAHSRVDLPHGVKQSAELRISEAC
jgi:hypothetical protein